MIFTAQFLLSLRDGFDWLFIVWYGKFGASELIVST